MDLGIQVPKSICSQVIAFKSFRLLNCLTNYHYDQIINQSLRQFHVELKYGLPNKIEKDSHLDQSRYFLQYIQNLPSSNQIRLNLHDQRNHQLF